MTEVPVSNLSSLSSQDIIKLKNYLTGLLSRELDAEAIPLEKRREFITTKLGETYQRTRLQLPNSIKEQIFKDVLNEVLGYGPIQPLLDDPDVTEVMVNGPKSVYIEKDGKLSKTGINFESNEHIVRVIERIILPLGRRIDADSPTVDARLPDGSRVNAIIPPVAIDGASITVRKFSQDRLKVHDLIRFGSMTENLAEFLRACVIGRLNIIISGGTGSGKTTLLNVLSSYIPEEERIVTIEDAAELQLQQDHIVRLETKASNVDGGGEVNIRHLVRNSLRMRPDRIVVGECRGGEALDMLQAMNTGHDGSMTTIHSNSPRDALSRLETLVLMAGMELPIKVIRQQVASAVDLIIQQSRLKDGSRKITSVTEVAGMEGDTIVLTDVFRFEQAGVGEGGKVLGELKPTGIRPLFSPRLEVAGFKLGPDIFGASVSDILQRNRR